LALAVFVVDPPASGEYRQLAERLGFPANTIAVTVRRWRDRLYQLIRLELAETLSHVSEVNREMRDLRAALV